MDCQDVGQNRKSWRFGMSYGSEKCVFSLYRYFPVVRMPHSLYHWTQKWYKILSQFFCFKKSNLVLLEKPTKHRGGGGLSTFCFEWMCWILTFSLLQQDILQPPLLTWSVPSPSWSCFWGDLLGEEGGRRGLLLGHSLQFQFILCINKSNENEVLSTLSSKAKNSSSFWDADVGRDCDKSINGHQQPISNNIHEYKVLQ